MRYVPLVRARANDPGSSCAREEFGGAGLESYDRRRGIVLLLCSVQARGHPAPHAWCAASVPPYSPGTARSISSSCSRGGGGDLRRNAPVNNDIAGTLRRMQPRWQRYRVILHRLAKTSAAPYSLSATILLALQKNATQMPAISWQLTTGWPRPLRLRTPSSVRRRRCPAGSRPCG